MLLEQIKHYRNIQNIAIRILVDARYNESTDPIYKKLKILKVEDIYDDFRQNLNKYCSQACTKVTPASDDLLTSNLFY